MSDFEQYPTEVLDYTADFGGHCTRRRLPNTDYALNTAVQPKRPTGWQYRATTAGRTGTSEPRWPTADTLTVVDGSVEWTCEEISTASLMRSVSTVAWTSDPGLTIGTPINSSTKSTVLISGGVEGQDYDITATATCSDGTYPTASFTLKIRNPARMVEP